MANNDPFVKIHGPALDDASVIVGRECRRSDVSAWKRAGYKEGPLPTEFVDRDKAYWKSKENQISKPEAAEREVVKIPEDEVEAEAESERQKSLIIKTKFKKGRPRKK